MTCWGPSTAWIFIPVRTSTQVCGSAGIPTWDISRSRESCATERPFAELRVHRFTGIKNLAGVFGRLNTYPTEWISGPVEVQAALIDGLHNRRASALYGILRQTDRSEDGDASDTEADEAAA